MFKVKITTLDKIMSVMLALMLVLGVVPTTVFASTSNHPNAFTFKVKEGDTPIEGAEISGVYYFGQSRAGAVSFNSFTTDANGEAVLSAVALYAESVSDSNQLTVEYTVTKAGYDTVSSSITTSSITDHVDVTMTAAPPATSTVTLEKSGYGSVKIDSTELSGSDNITNGTHTLKVVGDNLSGRVVVSLKINNNEVTLTDTQKQNGYTGSITIDGDTSISVIFGRRVHVDDYDKTQGTVKIGSVTADPGSTYYFSEGASVGISVVPATGYRISTLFIQNGATVDTKNDYNGTYSTALVPSGYVSVTVTFQKIYKIIATYDSATGTVKLNNAVPTEGQLIVVATDPAQEVSVNATPNEHYRVSKVTINDAESTFTENDYAYATTLTADKDYTIVVEFALNQYNVTLSAGANGKVSFNNNDFDGTPETQKSFEWNTGFPTFYVKTDTGYNIASVTATGYEFEWSYDNDLGCYAVTCKDTTATITSNIGITVSFVKNDSIVSFKSNVRVTVQNGSDSVVFNDGGTELDSLADLTPENTNGLLVRKSGNTLIFKSGTTISFYNKNAASSNKEKIELQFVFSDEFEQNNSVGNSKPYKLNQKGWYAPYVKTNNIWKPASTATISKACIITNVQLTGPSDRNTINVQKTKNRDVEYNPSEYDIQYTFIFDGSAPAVDSINATALTGGATYYSEDFDVSVTATDSLYKRTSSQAYNTVPNANSDNEILNSFSGISKIEYEVYNGDNLIQGKGYVNPDTSATEDGLLYSFSGNTADALQTVENLSFTVDTSRISGGYSENIKVKITVTDLAGKDLADKTTTKEESYKFRSSAYHPKAKYSISDTANPDALTNYYTKRTITYTIQEFKDIIGLVADDTISKALFNNNNALEAIKISIDGAEPVSISAINNNKVAHSVSDNVVTLTFSNNGHYVVSFDKSVYKNNAGLAPLSTPDSIDFFIDNEAPTAKIGALNTFWTEVLNTITFGLYSNTEINVAVSDTDGTGSDIQTERIGYAKVNSTTAVTDVTALTFDETIDKVTVNADELFVVYARVFDAAGNVVYLGTNGLIYDGTSSDIKLTPVAPSGNGTYNQADVDAGNGSIKVDVKVSDKLDESNNYSGIKSIDYKVFNLDVSETDPTQSGILYTFDNSALAQSDLCHEWTDAIQVSAALNNSSNVKVVVYVEDNAGNTNEKTVALSICNTQPTIGVSYADEKIDNEVSKAVDGYYTKRTATVVINCRTDNFDETKATDGIVITATNALGNDVDGTWVLSDWTTVEGSTPDAATHTATIEYNGNAKYTFTISYTDESGNEAVVNYAAPASDFNNAFTVDNDLPTGEVKIDNNVWKALLSVLTFGLYKNSTASVSIDEINDVTSPTPLQSVGYFKSTAFDPLDVDALNKTEFTTYSSAVEVSSDELFVVYFKLVDHAGNVTYLSTDGIIVDTTSSEIELTPVAPSGNGTYNQDDVEAGNGSIKVDVKVSDKLDESNNYSGIKSIDYKVYNLDVSETDPTQSGNLYTFDKSAPAQSDLCHEWTDAIQVYASLNNSSNVKVVVDTVDNAGNTNEKIVNLSIDNTAPVIDIKYADQKIDNEVSKAVDGYFTGRTATVVITERTDNFNAEKATDGIVITAKNAAGEAVDGTWTLSDWTTVEGNTPDEATHTATIKYKGDANYTFSISYTDESGNAASIKYADGTVSPTKFTVDTDLPTGSITVLSKDENGREETWEELRTNIFFGFWSINGFEFSVVSRDDTSPIQSISYYIVEATEAKDNVDPLDVNALDQVNWTPTAFTAGDDNSFSALLNDVTEDKQFTVYLKFVDNAGNVFYISTNGLIVDSTHPVLETVAPVITVEPEQPINGIYNGDVDVDIKVVDPLTGGTYSGLQEITYEIYNLDVDPDNPTQSDTLYEFNNPEPAQKDLCQEWTGQITIDSSLNNSNNVQVIIRAKDNAGNGIDNAAEDADSYTIVMIDTTAPVIDIKYDNNDVDSGSYFKADRTATITVTERNFNPDDVVIKITNTDGTIPKLVGWTDVAGTVNGDGTTHTATITYNADGDYTFSIAYTDLAGNECTEIKYAEDTQAGEAFTIDKTLPTLTVTYDNNAALNENYYKEVRTATITINEHNFSTDRINITLTATDDGSPTTVPGVSAWTTKGNTHTATIYYPGDALYTFDIAYTDLAGNETADYAEDTFYVDKTAPEITIGNVEANKPYNDTIAPTVTTSDTNYDPNQVEITLKGANRGPVELKGGYSDIHNGKIFSFNDFERIESVDDIYTLSVTVTDKAGNSTSQDIVFSVNRFGSVYTLDEPDTANFVNKYNQDPIDIIVYETNVNALADIKITLFKNGKETIELVEGSDYSISVSGGNGSWYQYKYTIFSKNFETDGTYVLNFHSQDEAGNIAENTLDTKNFNVSFGIDKTLPTISANNLENGKTYPVDSYTVTLSVSDNLLLDKIVVYLDGKEFKVWSADEIKEIIANGGEFTFDILGDSKDAHEVKVIATDASGREQELVVSGFHVTTNLWVRFYTNKPLFFGTIGGVVAASALIVFLVVFKRRKKDKEPSEAEA